MPCRVAISSISLGKGYLHPLVHKLDQAQLNGLQGIELFYEDLEFYCTGAYTDTTPQNLLASASDIGRLADDRGLAVVSLGPFTPAEGLIDPDARVAMLARFDDWMQMAINLNTDTIQIPSTFLSADKVTGDRAIVVADLTELADRAAQRNLRIAYECLSWGTHNDLWEHSWEIVQAVDRDNFGLCLDTFNIAARVYADPSRQDATVPGGLEALQASVDRMIATVDVKKIFYVEVVDGERLDEPLGPDHPLWNASMQLRMMWSRNCRLFYGEHDRGAYMPVTMIVKALLEKATGLGFEGWVSFELFNRDLAEPHEGVPREHAQRAAAAWARMLADVDFTAHESPRMAARILAPVRSQLV